MSEWQPARLIVVCGINDPQHNPSFAENAAKLTVRIKPSPESCWFCGGKAFTIHPDDAAKIQPMNSYKEMFACEKDVLTD